MPRSPAIGFFLHDRETYSMEQTQNDQHQSGRKVALTIFGFMIGLTVLLLLLKLLLG